LSLKFSELSCIYLINISHTQPTTPPIPSDYPDNLPLYNKSRNYPEVKEPAPKQGYILKSTINYQPINKKRKNNRVILGQWSSAQ